MYHIAIVEDEQFFSTQLQNYLKQYQEENDVEFNNNSISWCYVYILLNEGLIEILNDETTYNIIIAREKKFSKLEEILC